MKNKNLFLPIICLSFLLLNSCDNNVSSSVSSETKEPIVTSHWYDKYSENEIKEIYNKPIKIGYTTSFTYTETYYEIGFGNNKKTVYPFKELITDKFPNAEIIKIPNENDINGIINAKYDVVYGLNTYTLQRLKQEFYLKKFAPEWKNEVTYGLNDKDDQYFAIGKEALVTLYNYNYYTNDVAIDNYSDLWNNEAYNGLYSLNYAKADWNNVINKTFLASVLIDYRDDNAKDNLYISQEGWDEVKKMKDNLQKNGITSSTVLNTPAFKTEEDSCPTKIVIDSATDGVDKLTYYRNNPKTIFARLEVAEQRKIPFFAYGAAITVDTEYFETAKLFMEYVGSEEIEKEMSVNKRTYFPANNKVLTLETAYAMDNDEAGLDYKSKYETRQLLYRINKLEVKEIDWDFIVRNINSWITKVKTL